MASPPLGSGARQPMKLRNKPLNLPLEKRRYDGFLFVMACLALGVLHVKPKTPESWIAAIFLMAPTLWFVLMSTLATF